MTTFTGTHWTPPLFLVTLSMVSVLIKPHHILEPVFKALETLVRHKDQIAARWNSGHTNARLEGLNSLFQAARARARGYRNTATFITMIYLIAAPIDILLKST